MQETVKYRDRKNTDCEKWDGLKEQFGKAELLPAWVADMDFEAPACVQEALRKYVDFNVYGYYKVPEDYWQSFISWERKYHSYQVKKEWIRFVPGVVPAIYWLIQMLTGEGDSVLVMPPVYYPFFHAAEETGRRLIRCPLRCRNGVYEMDTELFKRKIKEEKVRLFILCSPHNPVGRVWTRKELKTILDLCLENHVFVIADEIHQDLITGEREQTAAAAVGSYDSILITLTSAAKTFNLSGCQNGFLIIPDSGLRQRYDETARRLHLTEGGSFGYIAVQAAYQGGRQWLEKVLCLVRDNYVCLKEALSQSLPEAVVSPLEGTYLAWVDLSGAVKKERVKELVQNRCGLAVDFGEWFGGREYEGYIRINLATSRENVKEIADRLSLLIEG